MKSVILRRKSTSEGRAIEMIIDHGVGSILINPQMEVYRAIGRHLSGAYSVNSFALGVNAAGVDVFIDNKPLDQLKEGFCGFHNPKYHLSVLYYFVGVAFAKGDWFKLRDSIQKLNKNHRLRVLTQIAQYYYSNDDAARNDKDILLPIYVLRGLSCLE